MRSNQLNTQTIAGRFTIVAPVKYHHQTIQRWVAVDNESSNNVWLQTVDESRIESESRFRFAYESRKLLGVESDQLAKVIAYGNDDGQAYIATEISGGACLADLNILDSSLRDRINHIIDVCKALQEMHNNGIIHRNIQLTDIYLDQGRAKLGGVGLTRYVNPADLGQAHAMQFASCVSPELSGALEFDIGPASDFYSVGCLMFYLLAGHTPFSGSSVSEILFQHLTTEPPFKSAVPEDVPAILQAICGALLAKDPPQRYQLAHSLIFDLESVRDLINSGQPVDQFVIRRHEIKPAVYDPAFVGRTQELNSLKRLVDQNDESTARDVLITSPSGIGKSQLVLELLRHAAKLNLNVVQARGTDSVGRQPMAPIFELISQLCEKLADQNELLRPIRQKLSNHQAEIAAVCPELAEVLGMTENTGNLGPAEFGQNRIESSLAHIIANVSHSEFPLLIWIDDCQWLDQQSLRILAAAQKLGTQHQCMLYSMRSECQKSVDQFLNCVEPATRIELGPLTDNEIQLLQESMTGPLPKAAASLVQRLASGSPFMASAVIRGMHESGAITPSPSGWQLDSEALSQIQAAEDAAFVLARRLQQLPDDSKRLLSIAAIIGKEFDLQATTEIANVKNVESHLELARKRRLIWTKPNGLFSFSHDKIREALIGSLEDKEKRSLHLHLANFLEQQTDNQTFEIAFHFAQAAEYGRALPYAICSAKHARGQFALSASEQQLEIAAKGLSDATAEQRYAIFSTYADVTMLDGRYCEAEKWIDKATEDAANSVDKAHMVLKQGELEFKRGDKEAAVISFTNALNDLGYQVPRSPFIGLAKEILLQTAHSLFPSIFVGRQQRPVNAAEELSHKLFSRLGHGYWYTKDKFHTLWSHLRGLNLAEKFSPTPELAQFYSEHAPVMSLLPWHERGMKYADMSLKLRTDSGDIWGQGQSRNFKSILLYSASEFEKCVEQSRRAIDILKRTGDYWEVHIARYQLAASLYRMGNLEEAVREARETYQSALELGDFQATCNIIDIWIRANLNELPEEVMKRESSRQLPDLQGRCQVLLTKGIHFLHQQQYDNSIKEFQQAIKFSKRAGVVNTYISPNYAWLATAMRLRIENHRARSITGDRKRLRELKAAAKQAVRVSRHFRNERPHALRELAAAHAMLGNHRQAQTFFADSIIVANEQQAKYEKLKTEAMQSVFVSEFGWYAPELDEQVAIHRLQEIESNVAKGTKATAMSLADRFEAILNVGRQISSSNSRKDIAKVCIESTNRLLRSQTSWLIEFPSDESNWSDKINAELITHAFTSGATAIGNDNDAAVRIKCSGSHIATPITENGHISAVLYSSNEAVQGLFSEDEKKIAEFIAAATGAALEKADSFRKLEQVNDELEKRVESRTAIIRNRSEQLEQTAIALRQTQASLELARDTAESANSAKSDFLARMSHEIRTPIAAILGYSELILRGVVKPQKQQEKIESIHEWGQHLLRLINNLLDLSKIEANELAIEQVEFNPGELVSEIVQSLQNSSLRQSVDLQVEFQTAIPRIITSDPTRFRQVMTNLTSNAIKFTHEGAVTIRLSMLELNRTELLVEVEDTGIGMSAVQLEKIFNPFTQADTSITREYGGTGLGLSISKRLIESMGGCISATSVLGTGSRFNFSLPVSSTESCDLVEDQEFDGITNTQFDEWNQFNFVGQRILIVDDIDINRDFLSMVLEESGADVVCLENGQQAVDTLCSNTFNEFDVVLMDMQMPILDGYSATQAIRSRRLDIPIIALTANAMKGDKQRCLASGCSDYLTKPVDTMHLHQVLKRVLRANGAANETGFLHRTHSNDSCSDPMTARNSLFSDLSDEMLERTRSRLTELQQAIDESDFNLLSSSGHWLKGTAGTVGLNELAEAGELLDSAGKDRDSELARSALLQIRELVDKPNGTLA